MSPDRHDHDHDHDHPHEHHEQAPLDLKRYEGISGWVVKDQSATKRELLAVLDSARLESAVDRAAAQVARRVTLKGFRPGKAPVSRIKQVYGADIRRDAVEQLVKDVWMEAAKERNLRPVGSPTLTELAAEPGEPVRFALEIEVLPEVKLEGLDAIRVEDKVVKVSDKDVEAELEALRSARAELVPAGRDEATAGDHAVVDLQRFAPGDDPAVAPPQEKRESLVVEVGSERNLPELDKALLGMTAGETRTFTSRFPAEHPDAALADKDVPFRLTLKAVKSRRLPELDEAFLQSIGQKGTVEDFRAEVRRRLVEARTSRAEREQENEAVEQLLARHDFEVPATLVEAEAEARIRRGLENLARQGVDVRAAKIDWQSEFGKAQASAERDIRVEYLLELVAAERGIKVVREDVDSEIRDIAERQGMSPSAVRSELEKSKQISNLEGSLRRRRALDSLKSGARILVE